MTWTKFYEVLRQNPLLTPEGRHTLAKKDEPCLEELAAGNPHGEVCEGGERLMSWRT
jgi:hypothetical protein